MEYFYKKYFGFREIAPSQYDNYEYSLCMKAVIAYYCVERFKLKMYKS